MIEPEPDEKELAFLKELEKHENKWVAITDYGSDEENIVATGDSVREARQNAQSQGFKDTTFLKGPTFRQNIRASTPAARMTAT